MDDLNDCQDWLCLEFLPWSEGFLHSVLKYAPQSAPRKYSSNKWSWILGVLCLPPLCAMSKTVFLYWRTLHLLVRCSLRRKYLLGSSSYLCYIHPRIPDGMEMAYIYITCWWCSNRCDYNHIHALLFIKETETSTSKVKFGFKLDCLKLSAKLWTSTARVMDYLVAYTIRMSLVFFVRSYLTLRRNFF